MASNALECDICSNVFSEDNCPRNLPCSHTFCGPCINRIIMTLKKTCPTCREGFTATTAEDLIINRSLLDVVNQLSTLNLKPKPNEFGKKFNKELNQETKNRILAELQIVEEMENVFSATENLNEMKSELQGTKKEIGRFKKNLMEIELYIEEMLGDINIFGDQLESTTDLTLYEPFDDDQEKVKKIKDLLRKNQKERDDVKNKIFNMKKRLKVVAEDIEKVCGIDPAMEEERFAGMIREKQMVTPITVKTRKHVSPSHYAEKDVIPKSLVTEHKEALMNVSSRKAFLDLAVEGTFLERIVIRVIDEGNLALKFLHMCAGDLGSSYANSHYLCVKRKGEAGERIVVRGYGIPDFGYTVDWNRERQGEIYKRMPWKAGDVRGWFSNEKASEFFVVIRDIPYWTNNCFGIVEEGLDALRDAISLYPDIKIVQIVNRGLFSPHFIKDES
ncbi:tripartite motif-containing 13-like [Palaemon carinicauda]|uniref:tripartite motif-containing 13-like n=1 Tax=Palaemon carinicauda TaxID=392227 RepID=UPI0035B5F64C